MKARYRRSIARSIILRYASRLEKDESDDQLVELIHRELQRLAISQKRGLLEEIKALMRKSEVKIGLSLPAISRILASLTLWEYVSQAYAASLLFDDRLRRNTWKNLSRISHLKRDQILAIVDKWD